ncbi:hypothetical protein [Micromonospora rubida]|uniref:hypothetical protein n=1 Tax=Micromonospora rubida TaxID=2697657 RepID=UPI00137806C1|nr:hypothetical protein [Micromonospora rubida]NBE81539.1 hypothetical protein [Micromonospora rubida]
MDQVTAARWYRWAATPVEVTEGRFGGQGGSGVVGGPTALSASHRTDLHRHREPVVITTLTRDQIQRGPADLVIVATAAGLNSIDVRGKPPNSSPCSKSCGRRP